MKKVDAEWLLSVGAEVHNLGVYTLGKWQDNGDSYFSGYPVSLSFARGEWTLRAFGGLVCDSPTRGDVLRLLRALMVQ